VLVVLIKLKYINNNHLKAMIIIKQLNIIKQTNRNIYLV